MLASFRRRRHAACDPGCDCDRCLTDREARERDELNNAAGCGPWMLLIVGFIGALTAIGVSLIVLSVELQSSSDKKHGSPAALAVPRSSWAHRTQARKLHQAGNAQAEGEATAAIFSEVSR